MPFAWVGAATSLIGAMDGGGGGGSQTTQQTIDPRMDPYVYGLAADGGILSNAQALYQGNRSGMNDQMRQGLNTQWGVYNDPFTMAGYNQMARLGSGLMGAPVMGNPFSDGRASLMTQQSPMGSGLGAGLGGGASFGGSPVTQGAQYPSYQPIIRENPSAPAGPFVAPPPPAAPPPASAAAPIPDNYFLRAVVPGWGDYGTGNGGA